MIVDVFIPCFIDQLFPQTAWNMVKVLEKAGCGVHYNPSQTCCGQLAFNSGFWKDAKRAGEKFLRDFAEDRFIVTPSASCTGYVRNYLGKVFEGSSYKNHCRQAQKNIVELTEFLVDKLQVKDLGARMEGTAVYHDSCSALRECGIRTQPRELLDRVKGLTVLEMEHNDTCCGFGGTFSVKFEPISAAMAEQKVNAALAKGASYLISTDLSCLMHLAGYAGKHNLNLRTLHIADVLSAGW